MLFLIFCALPVCSTAPVSILCRSSLIFPTALPACPAAAFISSEDAFRVMVLLLILPIIADKLSISVCVLHDKAPASSFLSNILCSISTFRLPSEICFTTSILLRILFAIPLETSRHPMTAITSITTIATVKIMVIRFRLAYISLTGIPAKTIPMISSLLFWCTGT